MSALPCGAQPAQRLVEFDIAGGPLGTVLLQIAQTSGVLISFKPSVVEQRQAPAVHGTYTLLEALTLTTQPSGLVVETTATGALTIVEPPPAPADTLAPPHPSGTASPRTADALPREAARVLPRVVVLGSSGPQEDGLRAVRGSSATRTDTLLADLPQSISVLTGESLDLQGSPTSTEALRYVTGVSSRIDVSGGQGIVPSLLVRGLPALYASSGMGNTGTTLPMDNVFIERIEVPKGPSNVISGVSSFGGRGGVVNLVRKEAGGDPQQQFLLSGTSRDSGTVRAEADLAGHATPALSWRMVAYGSATGRTDGGYLGGGGGGVLGSARYRNQDLTATLTAQADRRRFTPAPTSRGGALQADGSLSPVEDGQVAPLDESDQLLARTADVDLSLEWRFRPRWRMMLKTRIEAVDNDLREHVPVTPTLVVLVARRFSWWNSALQWGLVGDVDTGPVKHRILLGVDIADWRLRQEDPMDASGIGILGRLDARDVKREALLQDQIRYGNLHVRLAAQAARVPGYNLGTSGAVAPGTEGRAINWDAGALYRLSTDASVYAGSQYSIETDIIRTLGNPAIFDGASDPTRTQQFQAGLKLDLLDNRMALTLEAYRTEQINVPSSAIFGVPGSRNGLYFITPRRMIKGLEVDLAGRPWPALDVQLGMSFMHARDQLPSSPGAPLSSVYVPAGAVPARAMHLLSRYRLPDSWMAGTSVGLGFRARSSSFDIPPDPAQPGVQLVLPGGAQLDLSLERAFGPWAVNAFVHNVFDRQLYETQAAPGRIPLAPRLTVGLTATYKSQGLGP